MKSLGGDGLVQRATLQIKGATGHIMNTSGCIFIVISKKNEKNRTVDKNTPTSLHFYGCGGHCSLKGGDGVSEVRV